MRHPDDGTLRRLVDEPAGVADHDRAHVAGCPRCLTCLAAAQADAERAIAVLTADAPSDTDAAWQRLTLALDAGATAAPAPRRGLTFPSLRRPAIAAAGAALVLGGAGVAFAADWLPIFRTERIGAVSLDQADLVQLPDLSDFGDLRVLEEPQVREVDGAAAAARLSGLAVPEVPELPNNVVGEPTYFTGGQVRAQFTFDAQEAARTAAAAGDELPVPPPGMDDSRFRLTAGPGLAAVWGEARGVPALLVARAAAPTGASTGVPFATARDYLLSLPGVPDDVAAQLRAFSADGTTLPIPVPEQFVETSETEVRGRPATLLESRDGALAGVVWTEGGVATVVAGLLSQDEVLDVARSLR